MRVAFITHYPSLYGANRSLLNLIDGLVPLGLQPIVIVPSMGALTSALNEAKIPFLVVPHQLWASVALPDSGLIRNFLHTVIHRTGTIKRLLQNLLVIPQIVCKLKKWDVDIIYTNSSVMPLGAMLSLLMNRPHVWHLREFCDLDYNMKLDWGKLTSCVLRTADSHICVSKSIRSHYNHALLKGKNYVIYNGVVKKSEIVSHYQDDVLQKVDNKEFVFAIVGLIHPNKGQDVAIKALSLLKKRHFSVRLIIAGSGKNIKGLFELAEKCGVSDDVTFLGYVKNPFEVYLQSDAVLMCSKNEAMGRVTVEAMVSGRPVLGYDACGTSELVEHEFNGLLYSGGESELAACMQRLVERPGWAKVLGENGWRVAREKYTVEAYASQVYEILLGLRSGDE